MLSCCAVLWCKLELLHAVCLHTRGL
jgi:hypothetical protein